MQINNNTLRAEVMTTMRDIEMLIGEVRREAKRLGTEAHILRTPEGGWALASLIIARADCLHTLALLNTKE